jgi:integrase
MASIIPVGDKWRAQVRRKGHPAQTKTFGTKILAEKWARGVEAAIDAGRAGVLPKGSLPVRKLIQDYRAEFAAAKPFGRNKAAVLGYLETHLGGEDAYTLTAERLVAYIGKDRRISGVTASIDLTYLKTVLKVARTLWRLQVHPGVVDEARELLTMMGKLHRSNERDRRPTSEELDQICGWLDERSNTLTRDHIEFILDSAFRPPSEICGLRWADLNEVDKTILIRDRKDPRKKIGNNQVVPLLGRCMAVIKRQPKDSEFIFPVNGDSWSSLFPRACAELGIVDLRLYDLRHEAISRLVESGKYSIPEIMLVSGHKDPKQMMRYTQLRAKNLHDR